MYERYRHHVHNFPKNQYLDLSSETVNKLYQAMNLLIENKALREFKSDNKELGAPLYYIGRISDKKCNITLILIYCKPEILNRRNYEEFLYIGGNPRYHLTVNFWTNSDGQLCINNIKDDGIGIDNVLIGLNKCFSCGIL